MKIVFDNIVYSLQKSGGGSVYWTELVKRFVKSDNELVFLDQKEPNDNIFRKTLDLDKVKNESKWSLAIRRYISFAIQLFIRGIGYFNAPFFLFLTSIFIILKNKSLKINKR